MREKLNVILIVADEHSASKLGCYNNDIVKTPNIDKLADEGVLFERAYCNSPLCVPSRLSFLTGRYPWKIGAWNLLSKPKLDQPTIQSHSSQSGYRSVAIGKMHFVGENQMWGFSERPYGDFKGASHQPDPLHLAPNFSFLPAMVSQIQEDDMQESIANRVALDFLENGDHSDPFFMMLSYNKPHFPLTPPQRYWDIYPPESLELPGLGSDFPNRLHPWMQRHREFHGTDKWTEDETKRALAGYYGCVSFVDEKVGEILTAIEQSALKENTIIIYTSDHGDMCGDHGLWGKSCFYENSVRVPLIIKLPPKFSAHHRVSQIVELVDLLPTIADIVDKPLSNEIDGESLLPIMTNSNHRRQKDYAISELYGHSAIAPMRMLAKGQWKYVQYLDAQPSLFDLYNDPQEYIDHGVDPDYNDIIQTYDSFLRSDWNEDLARINFRYSGERSKMSSTRKLHYPNQFRHPDGSLVDAEDFYASGIYVRSQ